MSCGASGIVCFWNTVNARLVGKFVAHEGSNSIIMTVDGSSCFLVTADMSGGLKVWDIQVPKLICSTRYQTLPEVTNPIKRAYSYRLKAVRMINKGIEVYQY